jgi:hypothetical protein
LKKRIPVKVPLPVYKIALAASALLVFSVVNGQAPVKASDSTAHVTQAQIDALVKKFNGIGITGFIEPEYQVAQSKGINTYSGGNFSTNSDNRFIIRRGRLRTTYAALDKNAFPVVEMCIEVDATQKGINLNEYWGRFNENKWQLFSLTTGMMNRPFSNEINYPTRQMESPERGRMSQTLMRGEVDLGAMLTFEPRKKESHLRYLKASAGIFNGQGLTGPAEFDSFKDFIARISLKSYPLTKKFFVSGGLSYLNGSIEQNNRFLYHTGITNGLKTNTIDSATSNLGHKDPRQYYGADFQLKFVHKPGIATEFRAEYWMGKQTATLGSSETPATLPAEPYAVRNFNGAFFYLMQNIGVKHQLVVKYDIYDPNTDLKGQDIGAAGSNFSAADIKYSTLGLGYIFYCNNNMKLMLWYDMVKNESTRLNGYTSDVKDNVFTCRLQFKF